MARSTRHTGRRRRALLIQLCLGLAVLLLPAAFPLTAASFTGSTADDGNSITTAEVAAPSGLAVSQTCAPGPGIAFRAASSATAVDSLTLNTPAGTQTNDVLVAQVSNYYSANTLGTPSGWTLLRRETRTSISSAIFWRVATSSEPANVTFTISGAPGVEMAGGIAAYSGVSTTSPVNVSGAITDDATTVQMPSVTTTVANTMLVFAVARQQDIVPAPSGAAQRWSLASGTLSTSVAATGADQLFAGPGATGTRNISTSTSKSWVAHTVALRPLSGPPSANLTWIASPSSWATGYQLERSVGGTVQGTRTVTPISATSTTDGPLVNGTTYDYRLWAYYGTWTSPAVTATFTPSC